MKQFLILVLLITTATHSWAMCASQGLYAFPGTGTIKTNSQILISGYALSQEIISNLNTKYPVYLETKYHKVKLEVVETFVGGMQLTQAILKPTEKLYAGRTYALKIDKLDGKYKPELRRYNRVSEEWESISWKVEEGSDTIPPKWLAKPVFTESSTVWFGCGPAVYAYFKCDVLEYSHVFVRTELADLTSESKTVYILNPTPDGELKVGHGMCSGAFSFYPEHKYKIRFKLSDGYGNSDQKWSEWITFDNPYEDWGNGG